MKRIFAAVLLALISLSTSAAPTTTEMYDLQERCAKRTEEVFRRDWGNDGIVKQPDGTMGVGSFQNHYSVRLGKCFYLLTYETTGSRMVTLFDVNEQKEYGMQFKRNREPYTFSCRVAEKKCATEADWARLIAPYMEN